MILTSIGVDIGGSGIKAGIVDVANGLLVGDRRRTHTPDPSSPEKVVYAVSELVSGLDHQGPVGIGFPAVIEGGVVKTANNIEPSWIGVNALALFSETLGREVGVVNDADAAALCEARFGAAKRVGGTVLVITFGTGIGCGLLSDGRLIPNVQIGDIELDGHVPAEAYFSAQARKSEGLGWEDWASRVSRFLGHLSVVFSPSLLVIGGGVVNRWDEWAHFLDPGLQVAPASRGNLAGIIGAASLVG